MTIFNELPPGVAKELANVNESTLATETSLASEYATLHADTLRYCSEWGKWLEWDGCRWIDDTTLRAFNYAREVCADRAAGETSKKTLIKLGSAATIAAVERIARSDPRIAATSSQWDSDIDVINTPGGIVDLVTGEVRGHDCGAHMTKITSVAPAPYGTPCPIWDAFLDRVTGGDAELVAYLQRVAGYSLTGSTKEHALFFFYGTGRNGKGVFLNTISRILGDYATAAPMDTFTDNGFTGHSTEIASLFGARLVTAQETDEGRRWAESRIKALTGGDPITARFMRQNNFTFTPQFKLLIAGNHKPSLRNVDEAMKARFNLVPFTVTIPAAERDPDLPEKLRGEYSAILAWMVSGCLEWRKSGLRPPQAVTAATEEYLSDEDSFSLWIEECCERNYLANETASDLYSSWKRWSEAVGERPISQKRFGMILDARRFPRIVLQNKRCYQGLSIKREDYTDDLRYGG